MTVRIGTPVTGYGQESRNRAARQRIPNRVWTDEDGVEHVEVPSFLSPFLPHTCNKEKRKKNCMFYSDYAWHKLTIFPGFIEEIIERALLCYR